MRSLRSPGLPGSLSSALLGLALFLPGVGHSLAHHEVAEHHQVPGTAPHQHDASHATLTGEHHGDAHLHLDLVAAPSAKPPVPHAVVASSPVLALDPPGEERPLPPAVTDGRPPGGRDHGPPSPSRAPPLV